MHVTRFDKIVVATLVSLFALIGLLAWRGGQNGVSLMSRFPLPNAQNVSIGASIRVTFDQAMDIAHFGTHSASTLPLPLNITPATPGSVSWQGSTLRFHPDQPLQPETTYTITLSEKITSLQGRPLQGEQQWSFSTRRPLLLYLTPDEQHIWQVTAMNLTTQLAQRFSQSPADVQEYSASSDGLLIAYTTENADNGNDIWIMTSERANARRLVSCKQASCRHPAWSPDGTRLAYERQSIREDVPRLWWADVSSEETTPIFDDETLRGEGASWSSDGQWLSYIDTQQHELLAVNLRDHRRVALENQLGVPAVWHPQKNLLLFSDVLLRGESMFAHLFLLDVETGEARDLSGEQHAVEDYAPTWSPSGEWLVCSRKLAGEAMGKQLVMMRSDGSDVFPLTDELDVEHLQPAWSPDDRDLVFQRLPLQESAAPSEIWRIDVQNGQGASLVSGRLPGWLP